MNGKPEVAIVVLTGFADIFAQCRLSVQRYEPTRRKIVVTSRGLSLEAPGWTIVTGNPAHFIFARNANLGIRVAGTDDVVLLNDDVKFLREDSIADLQQAAYSNPSIGIVSPQFIGCVGNNLQRHTTKMCGPVYSEERLCFTSVYLKRECLDSVGELDETLVGYGAEDDDYCLRAKLAGWKLAVTPLVLVEHGFGRWLSTTSYHRVYGDDLGRITVENTQRCKEKWAAIS